MATFQEMIESLYGLDGNELRALAWEALLISDGPDRSEENAPTAESRICVGKTEITPDLHEPMFTVWGRDGWETGINTMTDTPIQQD